MEESQDDYYLFFNANSLNQTLTLQYMETNEDLCPRLVTPGSFDHQLASEWKALQLEKVFSLTSKLI